MSPGTVALSTRRTARVDVSAPAAHGDADDARRVFDEHDLQLQVCLVRGCECVRASNGAMVAVRHT
jgi:hypothetical protein